MKITKYGHSCLLIEEAGVCVLLDPGIFSAVPKDLPKVKAILLTHEHADHTHPETLRRLWTATPEARIITHLGVGTLLEQEGIAYELLNSGQTTEVETMRITAVGREHASIVPEVLAVVNSGYLIGERLFTPGDSFTLPKRPVEILALPIVAPWAKFAETRDYALAVKPKIVIPIHDGFLIPNNPYQFWIEKTMAEAGIAVKTLELGVATEF